jgi:hypothetical protein
VIECDASQPHALSAAKHGTLRRLRHRKRVTSKATPPAVEPLSKADEDDDGDAP